MRHSAARMAILTFVLAVAALQCARAFASVPLSNRPASGARPLTHAVQQSHANEAVVARAAVVLGAAQARDDAAAPVRSFMARRRRQYAEVFATGAAALLMVIFAALSLKQPRAVGVGIAALGALGIGALLQFSAAAGIPELMWPSPWWWLGTFAGTFMLAVMLAAGAAVLIRPGLLRGLVAVLIAAGVWCSIVQFSANVGWLVSFGTAVGALAAPIAAWSLASLSALLAERVVAARV